MANPIFDSLGRDSRLKASEGVAGAERYRDTEAEKEQ
jgi:hypothetical protein